MFQAAPLIANEQLADKTANLLRFGLAIS
jgi:hypothetical protein